MLNKVARHLAAGDLHQKNASLKSFEERPDILASERFLARIDERADHQTTAAVSRGRENTQEISRRLIAGGRAD
jgi:ribose 1,5-bisphosphokinase PhnN